MPCLQRWSALLSPGGGDLVCAREDSGREGLSSYGIVHIQNDVSDQNYVHLETEDLRLLSNVLSDLSDYYKKAIEESYRNGYEDHLPPEADFDWIYHVHQGDTGLDKISDGYIHYSLDDPGGCFSSGGHNHNKIGTCPGRTCTTLMSVVSTHEYWDGCSWHGYENRGATQYSCPSCGNTASTSWTQGQTPPPRPTCGKHIYTCGSPVNTWKLGCGKKTTDKIGATIVWKE